MREAFIVGLGMIRFTKYPDRGVRDMAHEVIRMALKDAGLEKKDLQAAFFSNTFWGMFSNQHSIRGQVVMRSMGIDTIPVFNLESACAGASAALHLAYMGIQAQMYECALVVGSEKLSNPDKAKSLEAFSSCMDVGNFQTHMEMISSLSRSFDHVIPEELRQDGKDRSVFMDMYSLYAKWHMDRFGSTQRQLAVISAKNHFHGSLNPMAQYRKSMTTEEVLADVPVVYPLTRPMCAPVGDGAAAAIVCSKKFLSKLKNARPIKIIASVSGSGKDKDLDGEDIGERLANQAYEMAAVGPKDISLAELHDATAWGELHQCESMGFCPHGEGGPFAESGATKLGGKQPVNTSGGLECRGHPIGASGLGQIYEIGVQLRGDAGERQVQGARLGLAENGGGSIGLEESSMCIHILEKV